MPDQNITCVECGSSFVFSERDQAFYGERGMTAPKRCKPCRQRRKASQGGGDSYGGGYGGGGGYEGGGGGGRGGDRQRYPITCQQCGREDTVPFKPSGGRPVLCRTCFSSSRPGR